MSEEVKINEENQYSFENPEYRKTYWHTCSHVLAQAVKRLWPEVKLAIGPSIETGFYYDLLAPFAFTPEHLEQIEAEMRKICKEKLKLERFELPREEAIKFMEEKDEPFKVELINDLPADAHISFYKQGEFTDLCAGPHLDSTGRIKGNAIKLTACNAAYWRGDSKRETLQRIYGVAFPKKDELDAYLAQVEEAKKRDHNKLGRELEYFTTVDCIGQGLPIMLPKGARVIQLLQRWVEDVEQQRGYLLTKTPLMAKRELYKISGHWDHYLDGMFVLGDPDDETKECFALRPMTCPFQYQVYLNRQRSYRDLPMLYNQWCSVVRWEKTTRPFLRSREFWWQEGHTIHETAAEAEAETQQQLNCYADVCEQDLAIPVVKGRKTDKEKFAGAEATYTIEAMMKDGKALQSGTSHYFGDKFSKAYDVTFTGRDNQLHHPFQTSWGVSTRLVGAIIMTHGDDDGLILPPAIAPIQVVVVPIAAHKPGVSEKAAELAEKISKYARVKLDDSDNAPGWKFSQWEMKGVPLRLEIGPKDLEKNQCVLVRRDTREKIFVSLDELETAIPAQLEALRKDLYERALANREKRTWAATTMEEVKELAKANTGYIKTMWCGDLACEMKMKEEAGLSSRCMPFEQEHISDVCPCCGKPASKMVYWGVAY